MVLLITSCIKPSENIFYCELRNEEERKKQYYSALKWAIRETSICNIVYCDNSGVQSDFFQELKDEAKRSKKNVEILCYHGDSEKAIKKGKGYGEGEIIHYALHHSELLKRANRFIKLTGRIKVENFDSIISKVKKGELYGIRLYPFLDQFETRFYIVNKKLYEEKFDSLTNDVDDRNGNVLEKIFYKQIQQDNIKLKCMKLYPKFVGYSGSTGKKLEDIDCFNFFNLLCRLGIYNCNVVYYTIKYFFALKKRIYRTHM